MKTTDVKLNYHKIRCRIFELGLTNERIAKDMDINVSTLSLKLNGHRQLTLVEVARLAEILQINTVNDFIEYFGLAFLFLIPSRENATELETKGA